MSFNPSEDPEDENTGNKAYIVELAQSNYLWNANVRLERIDPLFEANETGFLRKERYRGWQQMNFMGTYILGSDRTALPLVSVAGFLRIYSPIHILEIGNRTIQI